MSNDPIRQSGVPGHTVPQYPGGIRFTPEQLAKELGQHTPTPEQSAIISSALDPLLVVAGAGSGKTGTMADRVVWLVANGLVRPEQILGVTFTRKAAGELAARIRAQLATLEQKQLIPRPDGDDGDDPLEPKVSTYHSYANGIVADYGLRIGIESDSVLLGSAQSWQLASQVVEAYAGEFEHFTSPKSSLISAVIQLAGDCAEHLRTPTEVREYLHRQTDSFRAAPYHAGKPKPATKEAQKLLDTLLTRASVAEMVDQFSAAKRERGVLDFGDLVALAARIAREVPVAAAMERERYRVVLLDEFQDTSYAQLVLFSRLFGHGHAVTAVGDPNQSIYGFRGASAGGLFRFPENFPVHGPDLLNPAPTAYLTTAWRNDANILTMANTVSGPLNRVDPNRTGTAAGARTDVPQLRPREGAGPGEVLLAYVRSEDDEARGIAERIQHYRRYRAANHFETMAVLCRRRAQIEPIREQLEALAIPVEVVGLGGLLGMPEIVDLVATLRVLADPARSDALMRLLTGARWRLGPADLMAFSDWSQQLAGRRGHAVRARQDARQSADGLGDRTVIEEDMADSSSLVEALDWIPDPGWTSRHGRTLSDTARLRLTTLQHEIRELRTFIGDDLTTLLGEVERRMLLDIEVAAKPGITIHQARRHLDAFQDYAAGFAQTAQRVDLMAFLSWLDAAAAEESGLDIVQVEVRSDAVQLLTVHASKGLEWDVVVVPGLTEGAFPSNRDSRWSMGISALPWPLRGDRHDLPEWDLEQPDQKGWLDSEKAFRAEVQAHNELEERRLAYVAFTRARHVLLCTAAAWTGTKVGRNKPSGFLAALTPWTEADPPLAGIVAWIPEADIGEVNPKTQGVQTEAWPFDPLRGRRAAMDAAAARIRARSAQLAAQSGPGQKPTPERAGATGKQLLTALGDNRGTAPGRWRAEAELLLRRHEVPATLVPVELPAHISASMMMDLADDPAEITRALRRPVPRQPGMAARKGTAFHAWVEEFFGSTGMLDLDEYPGAADTHIDEAYELDEMVAAFKASSWANRQPYAVEVPIETKVDQVVVRGRIDAVFREPDGSFELVDWKTGTPASGKQAVRSIQLAVYRLAWARLHSIPLQKVKAAFFYVAHNQIIRPIDLAGEAELEAIIQAAYR